MMSYAMVALVAITAYCLGATVAGIIAWRTWRRLLLRLVARNGLVSATTELERRRVATDSGRDTLVRGDAGPPARITDGMRYRPGALAKHLQEQSVTKRLGPLGRDKSGPVG